MLRMAWRGRWQAAVTLALVMLLGACLGPAQESTAEPLEATGTTEARELPFETVVREDYYTYTGTVWEVLAPGIAIIAEPADVEQLGAFITPDSQARLRVLDYDAYFALVAFLDSQGCNEPEWGIEQIVLREDELEVHATYPQYDPERGCAPEFLLPYHAIRLPREGVWGGITHFTLYLNGEHAASGTYPPVVSQATPVPQPMVSPASTYYMPGPTRTPSPP